MRLLTSWKHLWRGRQALLRKRKSTTNAAEEPELPNGFLFNEKPLLPGEKRVKEPWENIWVYGMSFNFLLMVLIVAFKPDTSVSSWAKQKALERLSDAEERALALTRIPSDDDKDDDDKDDDS